MTDVTKTVYVVTNGMGAELESAWATQTEADKRANELNSQETGFGLGYEVQPVELHA
jgi:hypothetical protein